MNFTSRKQMLKYIENFRVNYKTALCKNFMETGICEFGSECTFAHGHHELSYNRDASSMNTNKNYKTKMCKQWHETTPGQCTYGDKCQFIHNEGAGAITKGKIVSVKKKDQEKVMTRMPQITEFSSLAAISDQPRLQSDNGNLDQNDRQDG